MWTKFVNWNLILVICFTLICCSRNVGERSVVPDRDVQSEKQRMGDRKLIQMDLAMRHDTISKEALSYVRDALRRKLTSMDFETEPDTSFKFSEWQSQY